MFLFYLTTRYQLHSLYVEWDPCLQYRTDSGAGIPGTGLFYALPWKPENIHEIRSRDIQNRQQES